MRILVTGHRGAVGAPVARHLERAGHRLVGFDVVDGDDVLDAAAVARAAASCEAVVHLAAVPHDSAGTPEQIMAVNVSGTRNVLRAAEAAGAARIVHFSTCQVFGIAEGERLPDYFPVDDAHPRRAARPYGRSKCLAEDLCGAFSARTGITTVCLRPVAVWDEAAYRLVDARRRAEPRVEWEPFWEYGAFVDVRDVAAAVDAALGASVTGHHRALLCAADISASAPGLELAARLAPGVPIADAGRFAVDPWGALVDCSVAASVLRWRPRYRWSDRPR